MSTRVAMRRIAHAISFLAVSGFFAAGTAEAQQTIGPCSILPADNIWNTGVDTLPVFPNSAAMVNTIGANSAFHADFGSGT